MLIKKISKILLTATVLFAVPYAMLAHDLFLVADSWTPKIGENVNVKMTVGHNFPVGSILATADNLKVSLMSPDGKSSPLAFKENGIYQVAAFTPKTAGTYIVMAQYPYYSTLTKAGKYLRQPKSEVKEPFEAATYVSRSSKIIIKAGGAGDAKMVTKPLGMDLEIVPQVDPTTIKAGGLLPVQILYKGKPIVPSANEEIDVKAVYAGFQTDEDTYSFAGHTDKDGMVRVKIMQPGTWMIIVERRIPATDKTKADTELYGATLTFQITK